MLLTIAVGHNDASAATITITENMNWSAISPAPTASDNIIITNGAVLNVNVGAGVCANIQIASGNSNASTGTLSFNSATQLTVSGNVTLGDKRAGILLMTNGGKLICQSLVVPENVWGTSFTPGSGTIELTATSTLPSTVFTTFNNLTISGGTTTLATAITVTSNFSINSGVIANLGAFTSTAGSLTLGGYGKNSGIWGGTGSGATNINTTYFAATTGKINVTNDTRPTLTVTASAQSKTYGGTAPTSGTLNINYTATGLLFSDAVNGATLGYSGSPSGNLATAAIGSYTITPSLVTFSTGSASNYSIIYSTGILTVNAVALTITANNQSKCFGQTFTFNGTEFSTSGLVNSDAVSIVTLTSAGSVSGAAAGNYNIVPSAATGIGLSNYIIAYSNGTLTVIPENTITAPSVTTFCATSSSANISIVGSDVGSGASYQWQVCTNPNNQDESCYTDISGANAKDYNPGTITNSNRYRRKISGACASTSNVVGFEITPQISSNTISPQATLSNCGSITEYHINGSYPSGGNNNNFTFQWLSSTDGVNFSNIVTATSQGYVPGLITSPIYYQRIAYSGYCGSYSNVLFYNTNAVPATPGGITGNSSICSPSSSESYSIGAVNGATSYTWSYSGTGVTITGTSANVTVNFASNATSGILSVVANNSCGTSATTSLTVTVNAFSSSPTTTGGQICIGSTATLSASGAVSGEFYKWYDAAAAGTLLKTSTNNTDNTYTTPVLGSTTNYWVSVSSGGACESARTIVTATFPALSTDDQNLAGTNSWVGHVYDGTNLNSYFGTYTEAELFNQSFGGTGVCFTLNSSLGTRTIYTETFSVRYRMNSTKKGLYVVDLGSDDGSRLTVDGTLVYNNWGLQAFTSRPRVLFSLTGSSNLAYEFYENTGGNQVVFLNLTQVLANTLATNTTQSICLGSTGSAISGDVYGTLPTGISLSGTGYQWAYSTASSTGPWTDISGATAATYSPSSSAAPFNAAGIYYFTRKAILSSANNIAPNPYVATNESNAATITVTANNTISLTSAVGTNAQTVCINTPITNVTYSTTGATGATVTNLPSGVTGSWSGNVVTISGTPTVAGAAQTYTVTLTGGCGTITTTGTIGVTANNTISLTSAVGTNAQTVCINTPITNITYSTSGATGATVTNLPSGVTGSWSGNVVTISGTPTVAGAAQTYTVTLTGGCGTVSTTGTITIEPGSVGGTVTAPSSQVCYNTSTTLTLAGSFGAIQWQQSADGINGWANVTGGSGATTASYVTPNLITKTYYRAQTTSGTCPSSFSNSVEVGIDTEKPVISNCPGNISVPVTDGLCSAVVSWVEPTALDNCTLTSFVSNLSPGATIAVGTSTVIYTATDNSGNVEICSFTITVTDNIAPTITCPANISVSGFAAIPPKLIRTDFLPGNLFDNCSINDASFLVTDVYSGSCYTGQPLTIQRTYQISDNATPANTAFCTQTITVNDILVEITSLDLSGCANNSALITSEVAGFSSPIYQWEKSTDGGTNWSTVGTNSSSLGVSSPVINDKYRLKVSTGTANQECYSNILTVVADTFKPSFPVTPSKYTGGVVVCDKTGPTVISDLISNIDAVDNCTLHAGLRTTYTITPASGPIVSGTDANISVLNNYPFPLGASTVVMDIVDESGNRSASLSFEVKIGAAITSDNITPDALGLTPSQGSTHTYSVTAESGYTYTWSVIPTSPTITGQGNASVTMTWGATTMPGDYVITVTKANTSTLCSITKTLNVTVLNVFNPWVADFGDACHGESGTTTILWEVKTDPGSVTAPTWSFTWNIYTVVGVVETLLTSGTETVTKPDSKTISYPVVIGDGSEKDFRFRISGVTDSLGNPETNTADNTDNVKIFTKPTIGF